MAILKHSTKNLTKIQIDLICKYMESSVCKIKSENCEGTAFFCLIPYEQYIQIPVIITAEHIIGEIYTGKSIKISLNNDLYSHVINFDESRLTYTNKGNDITIIEIKEKDGLNINLFFELDELIFHSDIYKDKDIYLISYLGEKTLSIGNIIKTKDEIIFHNCNTERGSSGAPIINLKNNKVIGIHRGHLSNTNINCGISIKKSKSVKEFIKTIKDSKMFNNTFEDNYFKLFYTYSNYSLNNSKDTYKMKFDISCSSEKLMELNLSQIESPQQSEVFFESSIEKISLLKENTINNKNLEEIENKYDSLFDSGTIKINFMNDSNNEKDSNYNINNINNIKEDNNNEFGLYSFLNKTNLPHQNKELNLNNYDKLEMNY